MAATRATRNSVKFSVSSELLRELGARLVGQSHIALAELIKNSYDADARNVRILFDEDRIVVEDDGHGMSYEDFVNFWMRIGTTHKRADQRSPELSRSYTGSKGVGRLSAQLLANRLEVVSTALVDPARKGMRRRRTSPVHQRVSAHVDWEKSVTTGELTSVRVPVARDDKSDAFAGGSPFGTRLVLEGLEHEWNEDRFRGLAQEIWALQPPFELPEDSPDSFTIELVSPFGNVVDEFRTQMNAIFENWRSIIRYRLLPDDPDADVLFELDPLAKTGDIEDDSHPGVSADTSSGAPNRILEVRIASRAESASRRLRIRVVNCFLDELQGEVRVFNLAHRQGNSIRVDDARDYMSRFGGVHLYDGGFRLPYYGPQDWLDLERDHARRLSRSYLLPSHLQTGRQMLDLPSKRRIFGTVHVSTAHEALVLPQFGVSPNEALAIQVTRDRLADNGAYRTLQRLIRLGLDLYAGGVHSKPKASKRPPGSPPPRPTARLKDVRAAVQSAENLESRTRQSILDHLSNAEVEVVALETEARDASALLGSLATIGMTTLAWDHESSKQRHVIMDAARRLRRTSPPDEDAKRELRSLADDLEASARALNDFANLFKPVLEHSAREEYTRLRARPFISTTVRNLQVLSRGASVNVDIPADVILPAAPIAAWTAVIQNIVVNAFSAVLDEDIRQIDIDAGRDSVIQWLRVQDTGVGVDLEKAPSYFLPFVRGMEPDSKRAELGLGGTGLGLAIVRMITEPLDVEVAFVEPDERHSTAVSLTWKADG